MPALQVTQSYGNIVREKLVDVSTTDYEDKTAPFFVRCGGAGNLKYIPAGNEDAETITKAVEASVKFDDSILVRKIISNGTTATNVYVGYGVSI